VILSARLGERQADQNVIDLAVAAEMVHAATLLHDDVLDEGQTRRGVDTARVVFGNSASILGGDHLLVCALQRVERGGSPQLLGSLLETISAMVHAEARQLEQRGNFEPSSETYDSVVKGKTAQLFNWSMRAGATLGGLSQKQTEALALFGHNLGMAFQLVDDTLDLAYDTATMGKDSLRDLKEGKMTWPLIIACQKDPMLTKLLRASLHNPSYMDDEERITNLRARILATDCVEVTRQRARDYAHSAHQILSDFPETPARTALATLLDGAVARVS
jgi:octaprenyl-diphosphate synthase